MHLFSQGRQKLARFSAHEFATLVIDILTDAKRRQWGNSCESPKGIISLSHLMFFANVLLFGVCSIFVNTAVKVILSTDRGDDEKQK